MPTTPDRQPPRRARLTGAGRRTSRLDQLGGLRPVLVAAVCICALPAALLLAPLGSAARRTGDRPHGGPAVGMAAPGRVTPADPPVAGWPVASLRLTHAQPRPVPASFLGLSTEYWTLPHYARQRRLFERVVDLLHLPGVPFTLRIGGESADLSWWDPRHRRSPGWAYPLTPSWLSQAAKLVADAHLDVVLDLNLADRDPAREAQLAQAVVTRLPPGSVRALEIGNEPDLYPVMAHLGLATVARSRVVRYFAWASRYSPATYVDQFNSYVAALDRVGVHLPIGGPEISDPTQTQWLPGLIAAERGRLAFVSAHRYPLSACEGVRTAPDYPTIRRLLANQATAGLADSIRPAVVISHRAGLPFGLTEFNAVTCGGTPAVSGTFANALWAPDALFSLMRVGVDAVDLHIRARAYNPPFFITGHGLRPRPILYGLILFQRMLGRDGWLVPAALGAPGHTHLRAWVVRAGGVERVLLINKGGRGVNIRLALAATGSGSVQRLLGGGPAARTGVTLAGQSLTPGGRWRGRFTQETVRSTASGYELGVPAYSAALVSLRLAPTGH